MAEHATEQSPPPATIKPRTPPPTALYAVINPVLKALLRSPLHGLLSGRLAILSFTGRRTGKHYSTPVGYVETGDKVLIATSSPWWRNLRGATVGLRLRGQQRAGHADVITDDPDLTAAFGRLVRAAPQLEQIIGVTVDEQGQPRAADVAAAKARGFVVVTVRLDNIR